MKLIFKHKILIYAIVIILLLLNIATLCINKGIDKESIAPIFVIYTQKENKDLEDLYFKIMNVETTNAASYMYLDAKNTEYTNYQKQYGLADYDNAFLIINRNREVIGIKTPCPDFDFIKEVIENYNY